MRSIASFACVRKFPLLCFSPMHSHDGYAMESNEKSCVRCHKLKPTSDFDRHCRNKDGLQAYCRECSNEYRRILRVKSGYPKNPELRRKIRQEYKKRNPEKYRARKIVCDSVRRGALKRQPCEVCGKPNAQAHHDDYTKPLNIKWLCHFHHVQHHKSLSLLANVEAA